MSRRHIGYTSQRLEGSEMGSRKLLCVKKTQGFWGNDPQIPVKSFDTGQNHQVRFVSEDITISTTRQTLDRDMEKNPPEPFSWKGWLGEKKATEATAASVIWLAQLVVTLMNRALFILSMNATSCQFLRTAPLKAPQQRKSEEQLPNTGNGTIWGAFVRKGNIRISALSL